MDILFSGLLSAAINLFSFVKQNTYKKAIRFFSFIVVLYVVASYCIAELGVTGFESPMPLIRPVIFALLFITALDPLVEMWRERELSRESNRE